MERFYSLLASSAIALATGLTPTAQAANILYVQDNGAGDNNIASVLQGDGHAVTERLDGYNTETDINSDLTMGTADLSQFDVIFWNASGSGSGSAHVAGQFTDLLAYVATGGRVFVTGYDSISSPSDPDLITFVGGSSSSDGPEPDAAVTGDNNLSTGVIDIRGLIPTGAVDDKDSLIGLDANTVCVVTTSDGCSWSLRTLGDGEIAYVSAGGDDSDVEGAWENTSSDGNGAYNAALRNFAAATSEADEIYLSDNGFMKLSGRLCDADVERDVPADLSLTYSTGPNSGLWSSGFFGSGISGPFVSHNNMRTVRMDLPWASIEDLNDELDDFGDDNCDGFDGVESTETEITKFRAAVNKRRTRANTVLMGNAFWVDERDRDRRITFEYKASMDIVEDEEG